MVWNNVFAVEREMGWARSALLNHLRYRLEEPYHNYYWRVFNKEDEPLKTISLY